MRRRRYLIPSAFATVALLAACSSPEAVDPQPDKPAPTTVADPDTPTLDQGTIHNPYPFGTTVTTDQWEVTFGEPQHVTEQVAAASEFNDPPDEGLEYWAVPTRATYVGPNSGFADVEVSISLISQETSRVYTSTWQVFEPALGEHELFPGGTDEGNILLAVPAGAQGIWRARVGFLSDPVYFANNR